MLDLNYVRENIDKVREALNARRADTAPLDDFTRADEERRRVIGESDQLNAQRNASSKEIGALMKEGKKDEAEARRAEVGRLKDRIAELDQLRTQTETRMQRRPRQVVQANIACPEATTLAASASVCRS